MVDSIQETPEPTNETIDRLSNNVRTLSDRLRDIANILGCDTDEIASAILRERKQAESRDSLAIAAAVQAERKEIVAEITRQGLSGVERAQPVLWNLMRWIESRPSPAVDVLREKVRELASLRREAQAEDEKNFTDLSEYVESEAFVRGGRISVLIDEICSLVDGAVVNDKGGES